MELKELIESVKTATGPDRELDGAIEVQARRFDAYRAGLDDANRALWLHNGPTVYDGNTGYEAAKVTASIDAALALVERLCPDLVIKFTRLGDGSGMLQITEAWCADRGIEVVDDMSPLGPMPGAVAIILALLTALDQKEENK